MLVGCWLQGVVGCWLAVVAVVARVAVVAVVAAAVVAAVAAVGGASGRAAGNGVSSSGGGATKWNCCQCISATGTGCAAGVWTDVALVAAHLRPRKGRRDCRRLIHTYNMSVLKKLPNGNIANTGYRIPGLNHD